MKRVPKYKQFSKNEIQRFADKSESFNQLTRLLGYKTNTGVLTKRLKAYFLEIGIDYSSLISLKLPKKAFSQKEVETKMNSGERIGNGSLKSWISKFSINIHSGSPEKCGICGLPNFWNDKALNLQLDHIDGDRSNSRPQNLRYICPNCHSQTSSFCGRAVDWGKNYFCLDCGGKVGGRSSFCRSCSGKRGCKQKKFEVTKEDLYNLVVVKRLPFIHIGKHFGVSDNAIRKRCKKLGIPFKFKDIKHAAQDLNSD